MQATPQPPQQPYPSPPQASEQGPPAPQPPMPAVPAWRPPSTRGLAYQFSGDALWSILFGVLAVVVPLVSRFYFPIMPLFGLWRGVLAVRRGRVVGGVIGLTVSAIGCLVSLLASGILFR